MSSLGVNRQFPDKPPAATAGSPGTAIFSPPAVQSGRSPIYSPTSSTSTPRPSTSSTARRDPVPVQWTFESSTVWPWANRGDSSMPASPITSREKSNGWRGSWFGRKKDKHASKPTKTSPERSRSVDASATRVPRSSSLPQTPALSCIITPPPTTNATNKSLTTPSSSTLSPVRSTRSSTRSPLSSGPSTTTLNDLSDESSSGRIPVGRTISHLHTPPLPTIPASNTTTPGTSNPPSPTRPASNPRPSFRPTSTRCPSSSSNSPHPHRSAPPFSKGKSYNRPSTSSGVSSSWDATLALGESGGGFGRNVAKRVAIPQLSEYVGLSRTSLVTSVTSSSVSARSRKTENVAEAAKQRRLKAKEPGFKIKNGKRHHPRSKEEAPYPRDYEHKTTDFDGLNHITEVHITKRFTCHVFDTPPSKVLDLGCGTGQWIMHCAREWRDTHFVGFDLVPIQPNLSRLGQSSLASRIDWVLGNFLEPLPFADREFDYVYMSRVAGGVPEDKWDALFAEVGRVLKEDGKFEMMEEDLFFPGSVVAASDDEDEGGEDVNGEDEGEVVQRWKEKTTGKQLLPTLPLSPSRRDVILHDSLQSTMETQMDIFQPESLISIKRTSMQDKDGSECSSSTHVLSDLRVMTDSLSDALTSYESSKTPPLRHANPALRHVRLSLGDSSSSPALLHRRSRPLTQERAPTLSQHQDLPRLSLDSWHARGRAIVSRQLEGQDYADSDGSDLYHEQTAPVINPRDHSILETAYNELHSARFINLTPLAVLNLQLALHFKNVHSHAPIQLTFPPAPTPELLHKQAETELPSIPDFHLEFFTSLSSRLSLLSSSTPQSLHTISPTEVNATGQLETVRVPGVDMLRPLGMAMPHRETIGFPAQYAGIDASALNIHLATRVAEVLACAEEMWEFIMECKESPARWRHKAIEKLAEVSREEWEDCLARYTMDMDDKIGMGGIVSNFLGWRMRQGRPSAERTAFDAAVSKWEKLRKEQNPAGKKQRTGRVRRARPLSRILKVFVAWNQ